MTDAVFTRTYDISTFLVSRQGRLSLYGLLNLLQDASIAHAQLLGHGMRDTNARQALWVLTRQKVRMHRWPQWNEQILIRTWVRPAEGAFAVRDFAIHSVTETGVGGLLGEATTSWLLLNKETRKPIRETITGFPSGSERCSLDAEKIHAPVDASKALLPTTALAQFTVRNSDIDSNQHVNNTRYSQWILDAIPIERHAQYTLDEYSVNFLSETRLGDTIEIHNCGSYFHGLRVIDRKIVFTAELITHPS